MMNHVMSAGSAPLPSFARAAVFALLAIAAVAAVRLWHHGPAAGPTEPIASTIDATQPLAPAPSTADMWRV